MSAKVTVKAGFNPVRVTHTKADGPEERLLASDEIADFEVQQDEEFSAKIELPVAPPLSRSQGRRMRE